MGYTQAGRRLKVTTPLGADVLILDGFSGHEAISRPFSFHLRCVAEKATKVPFETLLGKKVTIEVDLPGGAKRHFNGVCGRVAQGGQDATFTRYLLDLVPEHFLLARETQSRIFQHLSIPDILKKVLTGLPVTWEIKGTFQPRDYCVQYRESDFAFASRLMEEEGIYYFFKHSDGSHNMVVANTPASHPDLPAKSSLIFEAVGGGTRTEDRVIAWEKVQELRSGKVTLWDHCFELPHKHLEADKPILGSVAAGKSTHKLALGENAKLELYDFPGAYAQRFDGITKSGGEQPAEIQKIFTDNRRTAELRMEAEAAASVLVQAASNCRQIASGFQFTLERHFEGNGPWVVYQVEHAASASADLRSGAGGFEYQNSFSCFPFALPFRPPRVTPIPTVRGTQTAVVVGPKGEEIYTDKYGRVRVQFHWDREGKNDTDSSCWVRVAQPVAGRRWGASFWPRIGQEVIVDFLEGDPDQPIIVGSVYNADQMPPYLGDGLDSKHKNDNKVSGLKSNTTMGGEGFNEWRFDDTKGKQQLFLHAERNMDVRVKNDSMESVGASKHLTVGGEKDGQKWGESREHIFKDKHVSVDNMLEAKAGDAKILVGGGDGSGNLDLYVEGEWLTTVDKAASTHFKDERWTVVDKDDMLKVKGGVKTQVGKEFLVDADDGVKVYSPRKIILQSQGEICLSALGGFIKIDKTGVTIVGTLVNINSGGSPTGATALGVGDVEDAKKAGPKKPTPADDAKTGYKSSP